MLQRVRRLRGPTTHSDLRHPDAEELARLEGEARDAFEIIARDQGLHVGFAPIWDYPPASFDESLRVGICTAARQLGVPALDLPSRAGHDAWNVARVCPSAMIFIPCRDGISHNEAEHAELSHMVDAANVMLLVVLGEVAPAPACHR